jgi:dihydrofolate reductase
MIHMRKLVVFNQVTLDGYFAGANGDISWAHQAPQDAEWKQFVADNATSGGVLVFGRVTYEMMASYWPTPRAMKDDPVVAKGMNSLPKVVFSRTLDAVSWNNTTLIKGSLPEEMRKMKAEPGKDLVILGSGSIVSQLTQEGLIDEYQMIVNPVVLGKGKTMFDGITKQVPLKLTKTRAFRNGNVLLCSEAKSAG